MQEPPLRRYFTHSEPITASEVILRDDMPVRALDSTATRLGKPDLFGLDT